MPWKKLIDLKYKQAKVTYKSIKTKYFHCKEVIKLSK